MKELVATTTRLEELPDLLEVAGDDGRLFRTEDGGVAGIGEALRIELPHGLSDPSAVASVTRILASIRSDDPVGRPGSGPVAIGALPFDPAAPGHLVVPERTVVRNGDSAWVTTVHEPGAEPRRQMERSRPGPPPDEFRLIPTMTQAEWKEVVADAVHVLDRGDLDKVVIARRIDIEANRPFVVSDALERLAALYPSCMLYSIEGFLGASPELLIRRDGDLIESHPLAGTVARSGDTHGDEILVGRLMSSPKIRHEHRVVVDAIREALEPLCSSLDAPSEPSVLGLRNVSHLATHIRGRLKSAAERPSVLQLAASIHPTPAVGGIPAADAVSYIQKVEGFDRGHYAGPVGWIDANGDGCLALGIRGAEVNGRTARLFAGNGIVAGSLPADELAETQLKLQALLAALVRP